MEENEKHIPHPFELFGVECRKGWYDLILPIIKYIEDYNKEKEEKERIRILQIKEKFGGLCFYTNFVTPELSKMIEKAENESYHTCEECGSKTNVGMRLSGWMTTMCLDCLKKEVKEKGYPQLWEQTKGKKRKRFFVNTDGTLTRTNVNLP